MAKKKINLLKANRRLAFPPPKKHDIPITEGLYHYPISWEFKGNKDKSLSFIPLARKKIGAFRQGHDLLGLGTLNFAGNYTNNDVVLRWWTIDNIVKCSIDTSILVKKKLVSVVSLIIQELLYIPEIPVTKENNIQSFYPFDKYRKATVNEEFTGSSEVAKDGVKRLENLFNYYTNSRGNTFAKDKLTSKGDDRVHSVAIITTNNGHFAKEVDKFDVDTYNGYPDPWDNSRNIPITYSHALYVNNIFVKGISPTIEVLLAHKPVKIYQTTFFSAPWVVSVENDSLVLRYAQISYKMDSFGLLGFYTQRAAYATLTTQEVTVNINTGKETSSKIYGNSHKLHTPNNTRARFEVPSSEPTLKRDLPQKTFFPTLPTFYYDENNTSMNYDIAQWWPLNPGLYTQRVEGNQLAPSANKDKTQYIVMCRYSLDTSICKSSSVFKITIDHEKPNEQILEVYKEYNNADIKEAITYTFGPRTDVGSSELRERGSDTYTTNGGYRIGWALTGYAEYTRKQKLSCDGDSTDIEECYGVAFDKETDEINELVMKRTVNQADTEANFKQTQIEKHSASSLPWPTNTITNEITSTCLHNKTIAGRSLYFNDSLIAGIPDNQISTTMKRVEKNSYARVNGAAAPGVLDYTITSSSSDEATVTPYDLTLLRVEVIDLTTRAFLVSEQKLHTTDTKAEGKPTDAGVDAKIFSFFQVKYSIANKVYLNSMDGYSNIINYNDTSQVNDWGFYPDEYLDVTQYPINLIMPGRYPVFWARNGQKCTEVPVEDSWWIHDGTAILVDSLGNDIPVTIILKDHACSVDVATEEKVYTPEAMISARNIWWVQFLA